MTKSHKADGYPTLSGRSNLSICESGPGVVFVAYEAKKLCRRHVEVERNKNVNRTSGRGRTSGKRSNMLQLVHIIDLTSESGVLRTALV